MLDASWQNPLYPLDVNDDLSLAPIDAILVVDDLNRHGARPLGEPYPSTLPHQPYLDVNGDQFVAPIDVLLVVNRLNAIRTTLDVDLALAQDTGDAPDDRLTRDGHVLADVQRDTGSDPVTLVAARYRVNRGPVVHWTLDGLAPSDAHHFELDTAELTPDGDVRVAALFQSADGAIGLEQFQFVLDTQPPRVTARLATGDDTGSSSTDFVTSDTGPTLEVTAELGAPLLVKLEDNTLFDGPST